MCFFHLNKINEQQVLNLGSETSILLSAAGYKTCRNSVVALVSLFFIKKGIYDVYTINRALFNYEAKPLGLQ